MLLSNILVVLDLEVVDELANKHVVRLSGSVEFVLISVKQSLDPVHLLLFFLINITADVSQDFLEVLVKVLARLIHETPDMSLTVVRVQSLGNKVGKLELLMLAQVVNSLVKVPIQD